MPVPDRRDRGRGDERRSMMANTEQGFLSDREKTYRAFKRLIFWSSATILVVLALMAIFLT